MTNFDAWVIVNPKKKILLNTIADTESHAIYELVNSRKDSMGIPSLCWSDYSARGHRPVKVRCTVMGDYHV